MVAIKGIVNLKAMEEAHLEELWPTKMKELFLNALELHGRRTI